MLKVKTPRARFCQFLQNAVAANEEPPHISKKEEPIHNAAENAKRRLKLKVINHQRPTWMLEKLVIVSHALECSCDHDVLKMLRAVEGGHSDG